MRRGRTKSVVRKARQYSDRKPVFPRGRPGTICRSSLAHFPTIPRLGRGSSGVLHTFAQGEKKGGEGGLTKLENEVYSQMARGLWNEQ